MSKDDYIKFEGIVKAVHKNAHFTVLLENGNRVLSQICGKMRTRNIRVALEDKVSVEISSYDLTKGRIVYRSR